MDLFNAFGKLKLISGRDEFDGKIIPLVKYGSSKIIDELILYYKNVALYFDGDKEGQYYQFSRLIGNSRKVILNIYSDGSYGRDNTQYANRGEDYLLFEFNKDVVEIFVSHGNNNRSAELFYLYRIGALNEELSAIRGKVEESNQEAVRHYYPVPVSAKEEEPW